MTEHVGSDGRRERREDVSAVIREALPEELAKALPSALKEALPPALEAALWGDMRPARKWVDMRLFFERSMEIHEARLKRMEHLRRQSFEIGSSIVKDIVIHVIVSTSIIGALLAGAWKLFFHGVVP